MSVLRKGVVLMYCPNCTHETGAGEPLNTIGMVGHCGRCGTKFVVFYQLNSQQRYVDLIDYDNGCDGE